MKKVVAYTLLFAVSMLCALPNYAAPSSITEAQKKKQEIQNQLDSVAAKKKLQEQKMNDALKQKKEIDTAAKSQSAAYSNITSDIQKLDNTMTELDAKIKEAEESYGKQLGNFKRRLRYMFEDSNTTFLEKLINSKDLFQFYQRVEAMYLISKKDQSMLRELQTTRQEIERNKALAEELRDQKLKKASDTKQKIDTLLSSRSEIQSEIQKRQQALDVLEKEEDKLIAQSQEMMNLIKRLQSSTSSYAGGAMRWPLPSPHNITSTYGMRFHPILKKNKMHTGIDISAPTGNSIVAANKGKVIVAEYNSAHGKMIIIDHGGGMSTLYAHMSSMLVSEGKSVSAGQVIGKVGSTGWSTGPHLHFEVRKNGDTVNPLKYVSR